jgi:hypothetical protein
MPREITAMSDASLGDSQRLAALLLWEPRAAGSVSKGRPSS